MSGGQQAQRRVAKDHEPSGVGEGCYLSSYRPTLPKFLLLRPSTVAKYCNGHVCLCVRSLISKMTVQTSRNFPYVFIVAVVLSSSERNMLCTSGFVDDVMDHMATG